MAKFLVVYPDAVRDHQGTNGLYKWKIDGHSGLFCFSHHVKRSAPPVLTGGNVLAEVNGRLAVFHSI